MAKEEKPTPKSTPMGIKHTKIGDDIIKGLNTNIPEFQLTPPPPPPPPADDKTKE